LTGNTLSLQTARLDLAAATVEHLSAELEAPERLAELLGAEVPSSWPPGEYDRHAIAFFRARLEEGGSAVAGWYAWYGIRRATASDPALLVASAGYFGPPSLDGTVDIGYSVVPEWRGRGYATEVVGALSRRAFHAPGVRRILAEARVENAASIGVLKRCGFRRIGAGHEPGYDRFQRDRSSPA
jgi:[ribosomal protein S5]-alanine N-acetyltransferase